MREFEDSNVKYNQVTGDPSLEGLAEHPDTPVVPVTTENSAKDRPEKIVVPQEWAPFLDGLSEDCAFAILKHLERKDLQSVSLVNKRANFLARDIQLKRYKDSLEFSQSSLWQYLPAIAQDLPSVEGKAFIDYIEMMTNLTFNGDSRVPCEKLSTCIPYMRNRPGFPANWSAPLTQTANELQTVAQEILALYPDNVPKEERPTTLKGFMNLCTATTQWEELSLWQKYHKLDSALSIFLLFFKIQWIQWYNQLPQNQQNQQNRFNIITDLVNPKLSGLLTGSGLMLLDRCVPGIFSQLVREAIWWFKKADKVDWEIARLKNIECLLGRLTEADLLRYIPTEYYQQENPPNDLTSVFAPYPYNVPYDPQRALLIEVIQADYQFLMKKLTEAVMFKIERTNFRKKVPIGELTLNQTRVVPLILGSSILLENLGQEGLVKVLYMLGSTNEVIRNHPVLWPFLTFEVITHWFQIDTDMTHCYAEFILSNAVILRSLTNEQIISIAQHLGPKEIVSVFDSPAFRARLEEDKAQNDDRENKLLMQLMGLSENFLYQIAQSNFAVGLLTRDEVSAILFPKSGKCMLSVIGFLLHNKRVIIQLSSTQLLQAIQDGHNCHRIVAQSYLTQFNHDDLVKFSSNCFHLIESQNNVELNILLETLPTELAKRAEKLTSTQWLTFARMHPQIVCFIVDRYSSKLEDRQLESLSRHYKDNAEILQKITSLIETRAQEKRKREAELLARQAQQKQTEKRQLEERRAQEEERKRQQVEETQRKERNQKRLEHFGYPPKNPQPKSTQKQQRLKESHHANSSQRLQEKTPWAHYFRLAFFTTLGLVGFTLFLLGIGSALGIPVIVTMTSSLFSFLPWSTALTSFLGGYLVYLAAAITAAVSFKYTSEVSNKSIPEKTPTPNKSSCSTASFFDLFDCWPQPSQTHDVTGDVALSQLSFKPSTETRGVRANPVLKRIHQGENDESSRFGFQ